MCVCMCVCICCVCVCVQLEDLQAFLTPLIKKVMEAVTPETIDDWVAGFSDISVRPMVI